MKNFNEKYKPRYDEYFSMVMGIGDGLNSRKDRFDKADLLENGLEKATDGALKWKDEIGFDMQDEVSKERFEVKSQKFCLYTKNGNLKGKTKKIKLVNTLQQGGQKNLKASTEWLIIVDTGSEYSYSMAIIEYSKVVEHYSHELSDGFECQIPISELTFLIRPHQIKLTENSGVSYRQSKVELQNKYVSSYFPSDGGKNENNID